MSTLDPRQSKTSAPFPKASASAPLFGEEISVQPRGISPSPVSMTPQNQEGEAV